MRDPDFQPFVSIAMATYNSALFVREQIDSLLSQSYQNFEIVISDDKSTDGTQDILKTYSAQDKRIRWSENPYPAGCSKNFERVFGLCVGEIIFVCDSDDAWYSDKLQMHLDAYQDKSVGWVYNRSVLVDASGVEFGHLEDTIPSYYTHKRSMLENAWGSCIGGAHASYRAYLIHRAMPMDPYAGAFDSWIQLAIWPAKSIYIDKVLQVYRRHGSNVSIWNAPNDKIASASEVERIEKAAIENNLNLIGNLPYNKLLPIWKRVYFMFVYIAKRLRLHTGQYLKK